MPTQRDLAAGPGDRPYNNLLRRLSHGDYALIAPYLLLQETRANTLLYNPGDNVITSEVCLQVGSQAAMIFSVRIDILLA